MDFQVALLKRQYLQLLEPEQLSVPGREMIKLPQIQSQIFETMFRDGSCLYLPPDRYRLRVLKKIVARMEEAIDDPEEDEISDDLISCLAELLCQTQLPPSTAVQKKSYVTYTLPTRSIDAPSVTLLEARSLLASSGTTGLRTWEASLHLSSFLFSPRGREYIDKKEILELGAGTGLVSLLCAKHLGAKFVMATDGSGDVINDFGSNIFLNGFEGCDYIGSSVLKWGHPLSDETTKTNGLRRTYDLILGADITYDTRSILALVSTLQAVFDRNQKCRAILCSTKRNDETLQGFIEAFQRKFTVDVIEYVDVPENEQAGVFHATTVPILLLLITSSRDL